MNLYVCKDGWMEVGRHVNMYAWMNGYRQNYMYVCAHIYIHTHSYRM